MKNLFDFHTHSTISDGGNSPEEMLEGAAAKGIALLALTDHFDIHEQFPEPLSRFDGAGRESSYKILSELKQKDFGIKYLKGIEIGQAHQFKQTAEGWLSTHDYDFVLASCHIIRGHIDFYNTDYTKNNPDTMLTQYFTELQELVQWGGTASDSRRWFDSLAHLTYPLRYMKGDVDLNRHLPAIDELFRIMIKNEIALEINTGGTVLCPELPQLSRYRELGGRLITIGSDSHSVDSLANKIQNGIEAAKAAGFTECAYFENRKPHFIEL